MQKIHPTTDNVGTFGKKKTLCILNENREMSLEEENEKCVYCTLRSLLKVLNVV